MKYTDRRNGKVDQAACVWSVASYWRSSLFWVWTHCLDKQEWSDPEMTGSEVKEPIHLSELQFRPGMCYCLYLTGINIVSDTFLHNIQPFAFRLLDPGAWRQEVKSTQDWSIEIGICLFKHSCDHSLQELSLCIGQPLQLQEWLVFPAQLTSVTRDVNLRRFTAVLQKGLGIELHEVREITSCSLFWSRDKPQAVTRGSLDAPLRWSRMGLLVSHAAMAWLQTKFLSCKSGFIREVQPFTRALAKLTLDWGLRVVTGTSAVLGLWPRDLVTTGERPLLLTAGFSPTLLLHQPPEVHSGPHLTPTRAADKQVGLVRVL